LLNGRQIKIQGTANHQDHAGVGSAVPDALHRYRLQLLREMGCNAVRTSHNMPAPAWVEACDRAGMMLYCETRHMGSSPEYLAQLATLVKRYRNSPSVIIWGISNEERILQNPNQLAEQGERVAASMVRLAHKLDPTRVVSGAVDGDNEHGLAKALDIAGFNYNQKFVDPFHAKFPARAVFASEQASTVATRGEYRTDKARNIINGQDAMYGLPEDWWKFWSTREWTAGGFMWSGFDYRGEPSPYRWPSISSQFGSLDTCGFPKDYYYYYRAWWRDEPLLHLFPHWNWEGREGDEIPVWVYSNLDEIELLVNGKSLGSQKMPKLGHIAWKARYEPGTIEARGMKDGKVVLTERRETTGATAALRVTADRTELSADGQDVAVLKTEALDSSGRWVPTAADMVRFTVSGPGRIIGVGNGDPNSHESDKEPRRSLYNGLVQAIIQSTQTAGEIHVTASAGQRGGQFTTNVVIVSRSV
jgi:beta-galactosidase